jgi:signal transduction histidine kinase
LSKDGTVQQISWASIGHKDGAQSLAADRSTDGLWLGFDGGGVAYFSDGQIKETYGPAEGLGSGRVTALHIDTDDTVWAATEGGLSRIKDGRVLTLTSKNGLPCDSVHWITQDENDSFWLLMTCGLVRIVRTELHAWTTDSQRKVKTTLFDSSDGVPNEPISFRAGSQVTRSLDGKMWFQGFGGASVIDPQHLPSNKITPPVRIERITANDKTYDASNGLRLPPRVRDLKIDYTALSFVAPEKVQFRYQLEGQDRSWREVVNDREVQYSNLPPGKYVFRVTAANNSGLWNEAGDTLHFSIAPMYYETNWFRAACLAALMVLVWALYRMRLHQLRRRFHAGLEARESERTRIARELHDTLLQNLNGLMIQFQAARNMLPGRPDQAAEVLDNALGATEYTVTQSRSAIQHLRSAMGSEADLAQWLTATSQELARSLNANADAPIFQLTVEGDRKALSPLPRDEVCLITREILRNALQHARASRIETEIRYDEGELRVRIRDDGKGIEPQVLQAGGKEGHWGLRGARERAQQIGARLDFWSEIGAGTEVELLVPAAIAYQNSKGRRRLKLFRKV